MADIVLEELDEVDTIVGISLNGILFANSIADQLNVDVAIFRSVSEEGDGHLSNKYGNVAGRKVVVVDDGSPVPMGTEITDAAWPFRFRFIRQDNAGPAINVSATLHFMKLK